MLHIQTFKTILLPLQEKETVFQDGIEESGKQASAGLYYSVRSRVVVYSVYPAQWGVLCAESCIFSSVKKYSCVCRVWAEWII